MIFWQQRELIFQLLRQELQQQYRGALLGFLWSVLAPLTDLLIYSFVFGILFGARTDPPPGVSVEVPFSLVLLAGLVPFNMLNQTLSAAPFEILSRPNYVKKVRFPLEVLSLVRTGVGLFHSLIGLAVLIVGEILLVQRVPWTALLLPLVYLPLFLLSLGLHWFFSALGVYLRDLQTMMTLLLRVWFFATPIVYTRSQVPSWALRLLDAQPMTFVVGALRDVLLWGQMFSWPLWLLWTLISAGIAWLGYRWFQHTREGFADVL